MVCENGHTEEIVFNLIDTPTFGAILGIPWLQLHNLAIDWSPWGPHGVDPIVIRVPEILRLL